MEDSKRHKIAVIGLGNILMGDEGVGVRIIHELQKNHFLLPASYLLELIDGGTAAFDVILSLDSVDKLIIIDAVKNGGKPGEIYRFGNLSALLCQTDEKSLSLHDVNLIDALKMADKLKKLPRETVLIGIEPKEIKLDMELSEDIKSKIPEIIKIVLSEVQNDCFTAKAN